MRMLHWRLHICYKSSTSSKQDVIHLTLSTSYIPLVQARTFRIMPSTAHSSACRYIAITGLVLVRESTIDDPKQSKLFTTRCDFNFRQDGFLTIGVRKYTLILLWKLY